jgi:branched-chain amino acid transport system permease protein
MKRALSGFWRSSCWLSADTVGGWIGAYYYTMSFWRASISFLRSASTSLTGITGQFSIGHAGFYAVGAYTSTATLVT